MFSVNHVFALSLMVMAGIPAAGQAQTASKLPHAWPRPGSTLLIDNDRGAAFNVVYTVGVASPMHQHLYDFVGLDLNTAAIEVKDLKGKANIGTVIKNDMWFLLKGEPHQEMSIVEPGRHTVVIDIKAKRVPEATNTSSFPANKYARFQRKVADNDEVVIWNCAWAPGQEAITSFNTRDMFLAFAEGGDLSIATPGQAPKVQHYEAGQAIFLPAGQIRSIRSAKGAVHAMLVEMK
jgi:hypothetical protein